MYVYVIFIFIHLLHIYVIVMKIYVIVIKNYVIVINVTDLNKTNQCYLSSFVCIFFPLKPMEVATA